MENYALILNHLSEYDEDEIFYRDYYYAQKSPEKLKAFLAAHTPEEVQERRLICPELCPWNVHLVDETSFFRAKASRNVWVQKHSRYSPPFLHSHEYFEIFYVLTGSCTHTICGRETVMPQGTLCFIAPYVEHSVGVFDDSIVLNIMLQHSTFDDIFFNLLRSQNVLSSFFLSNLYTTSKMSCLCFQVEDEELINLLLSMILEEVVEDDYTYRILSHIISIFFTKLVRKYGKSTASYTLDSEINQNALDILSYINDHYKTVTLEDVAEHYHYTPAHCSRLIKAETGQNFTQLLRNVRLRRAETLLLTTSCSVEEISYMIGYENAATFIKRFKEQYQMTPGQFRQKSPRLNGAAR
ncbi:MAG: AraC family transcriptional regulator [Eubacteriales bacterium]|nr:AraC family transcriptional regulator [Eubacteriales bacterium]